ncbi:MAG: hypothetical protein KF893_13200 [Caldilineaceae bacterium]|nr:hypothetical protein [Caldilineaceae bacterium]
MDEKHLEDAHEAMRESIEHSQKTDAAHEAQLGSGAGSEQSAEERKATEELSAEINRLAEAFSRAVRAAWQSDQRKQLETDLNRGLRSLVDNVEETLVKFNRSEQGQELREQAERVVVKVRSSKVTEDLRQGLTKGLGVVAAELQELAERMEKGEAAHSKSASSTTDDPQDIPVSREDGENKPGDTPQA